MYVGSLLGSLPLGSPVSIADASVAPMGDALEADLAIRRRSPAVDFRADRRLYLRSRVRMLDRSGFSLLHSLALCVLSLYKEAFGSFLSTSSKRPRVVKKERLLPAFTTCGLYIMRNTYIRLVQTAFLSINHCPNSFTGIGLP